jgi:photoactive yellow protein
MATRTNATAACTGLEETEVSDKEVSIIPFGAFELNAAGMVVHYSPATDERKESVSNKVVGQNFFDDLFPALQVEEMKSRFHSFMAHGTSVERFTVSFPYNRESIKVQIVMAHLSEKTENGHERFALVRLMPEMYAHAPSLIRA